MDKESRRMHRFASSWILVLVAALLVIPGSSSTNSTAQSVQTPPLAENTTSPLPSQTTTTRPTTTTAKATTSKTTPTTTPRVISTPTLPPRNFTTTTTVINTTVSHAEADISDDRLRVAITAACFSAVILVLLIIIAALLWMQHRNKQLPCMRKKSSKAILNLDGVGNVDINIVPDQNRHNLCTSPSQYSSLDSQPVTRDNTNSTHEYARMNDPASKTTNEGCKPLDVGHEENIYQNVKSSETYVNSVDITTVDNQSDTNVYLN